jgi:hypothetical protein
MLNLLWGIAVVFFIMWLLGFAAFHVTSGLIHLLLMVAVGVVLFRLLMGRRVA